MTMILLVDDDPIQLKMTQLYLADAGYEVTIAMNGTAALAAARVAMPDLIVSDVVMRGLDGFGLVRELQHAGHRIPTVLLSAQTDASKQALARELGVFALVQRTGDFAAELAAVRACLDSDFSPGRTSASYEQHLTTTATELAAMVDHTRATEERYRLLLDHATDAVSLLTTDGYVLEANKRWESLIGLSTAELIGTHINEYRHPELSSETYQEFYNNAVAKRSSTLVMPLRHSKTGQAIHVEFSIQIVELDGREAVLSIGRDITDRVESLRRAMAAEQELRSIVERIPDCVWRADSAGNPVFCTPNIEQITGYSAEVWLRSKRDQFWATRVHPEDRELAAAMLVRARATLEPCEVEYRFLHKDERWIWLRVRIQARREGDTLVLEGLTSDITKRRELEESLNQAQKMEAIGCLSGGVAHDFNNILAVILAHSSFLLDDLAPGDRRREEIEPILAAAERAAGLTRQLLAFSRRQVLELVPADLNCVLRGVHKMLGRLIGEDIELVIGQGADLWTVRADVGQLEQVVMNLVVNARDAMPSGGKLEVDTRNVSLTSEVVVGTNVVPAGSYVALSVRDSGTGMDAVTQQRVFEPFFTTKGAGKGTGLGLSTCYGIVKQFGGYIWCHSELGRGTVFEVYLPRVDAVPLPAPEPTSSHAEGTETVLLVEDDQRVRSTVQRILRKRGFKVMVGETLDELLAIAAANRIDLILSDVVMPGHSGPEVAERIRQVAPSARLLLMSGYSDHPLLASGVANDLSFLHKPFTPDGLIKKVREVLDRQVAQ